MYCFLSTQVFSCLGPEQSDAAAEVSLPAKSELDSKHVTAVVVLHLQEEREGIKLLWTPTVPNGVLPDAVAELLVENETYGIGVRRRRFRGGMMEAGPLWSAVAHDDEESKGRVTSPRSSWQPYWSNWASACCKVARSKACRRANSSRRNAGGPPTSACWSGGRKSKRSSRERNRLRRT